VKPIVAPDARADHDSHHMRRVRRRAGMERQRHAWIAAGITLVLLLAVVPAADAQVVIKVNEDTFFKLGLLLQTQADAAQDPVSRAYAQNVFVRRVRLLLGGQLAKNVTFFVETDSPNLGKSLSPGTKNSQPSLYLQDAYVEWKVNDKFALDAGLMLMSVSRNGLQSAASLMPVDYGPYTFAASGATQSNVGRDTGIQAKGYFLKNKLEYRAGISQGMRDTPNRELRYTARVMYNFFEPETGFFYTGTYLGKKKVVAVGGGVEHQHGYNGYAADVFFDIPLTHGAVTGQVDHIRFNGGDFLKSLKEQESTLVEAGYLIGKTNLQPVVQFSQRSFANGGGFDENRYGAGLNYFLKGHTANVKAIYNRIDVDGVRTTNQFTVQIQFFYF
jgi:hypothetical protein